MAKREIDEAELLELNRARELLSRLNNQPEARRLLEQSVKKVFPEVKTQDEQAEELARPHLQKVEETAKALQDRLDAIDAREKAKAEEVADNDLYSRLMRVQKDNGLTDEGLAKVVELMKRENIGSPEAAAAYYDRQNPKPPPEAPATWEPQRWNYDEDDKVDMKALFADPDRWADKEVGRILQDERRKAQIAV